MRVSETDNFHEINQTDVREGVEVENDEPNDIEIKRPFNPEKIKVRTVNIVVDQIVTRIQYEEIDLSPDFQRLRGIWSDARKSRLIESLLLRIPIPVFYVSADEFENWAVVDGVQRMSAIYEFIKGKYALIGLEYFSELIGKKSEDIPRNMFRRISETQLVVNVIDPGTPVEVMFNIFHRINTGGMILNGQEIRHALNPGPARDYLKMLAESDEFLKATDYSIGKIRMADRECVLRFLAFYMNSWENYHNNDLDGYLVDAMKRINQMNQDERNKLEVTFIKAMKAAKEIFDTDAFRKRFNVDDRRKPVNKALFEIWGVGLAECSPIEIRELKCRHRLVKRKFMNLLNDGQEFEKSISFSTGSPQRVKKRFKTIENLIREILIC